MKFAISDKIRKARFIIVNYLLKRKYCDKDITFYLQVYKDYELAYAALKRLRSFYPVSRIIVVSDGDQDVRYKDLVRLFNVEYIEGERLYTLEHGGEMLQRMFQLYLNNPSRYLLKMDTDTRFDRRLKYLLRGSFVFGQKIWGVSAAQGGCILVALKAAKKIYDSRLLLSEELKDYNSWGKWLSKELLAERVKQGLISFEWVLFWVSNELKIKHIEFEEIYSIWRTPCKNPDLRYAVVHPDKDLYKKINE